MDNRLDCIRIVSEIRHLKHSLTPDPLLGVRALVVGPWLMYRLKEVIVETLPASPTFAYGSIDLHVDALVPEDKALLKDGNGKIVGWIDCDGVHRADR